ncbi:MAG: MBL fold metallo-hydrolase, partial [Planctomycetota bacterium]|nr:MBL fold metallo-hydrolase [Planctomycetota bacterium]
QLDGVRYTFISVGQGLSVLIECPDGRTILYDAGSIPNRTRATRAVQELLWERGITHLDAVIVSHADVDHFNGLPQLLEQVPTGRLLIARSFLDFQQSSTRRLCDIAAERGVPIRLIQRHDRIDAGDDLRLIVLHPAGDPTSASHHDNANSIVLACEYAGRRVLLTGDIESYGLDRLLERPPMKCDVLLAPHHGSRAANPPRLNEWADPDVVIQSGGRAGTHEHVRSVYKSANVMNTRDSGTITVTIHRNGEMAIDAFRR